MRKGLWLASASLAGLVAMTAPVLAQQQDGAADSGQQAERRFSFAIPAQPLGSALAAFSRVTGLQTAAPASLLAGRQGAAVTGAFTAEDALRRLLAGSGLSYRISGNAVTLAESMQGGDAAVLPPISVEGRKAGDGQNPAGHVDGYVATRSLSATKTDAPLIETPQSVSVITSDQIAAQKAQTVGDALRYTPGVLKLQGFNRTDDSVVMRGFQSTEASLYLDGMRTQPNIYSTMAEPYALERIEVLRGPSSVLYGQSSPGGTISMQSKLPTVTPLHEIQVEGGNYGRKQIATDHGGALDEDGVWSYRLVALGRDSDTMVDYINDDRAYLAPSLTWRPNEDTALTLLTNYSHSSTAYYYGFPPEGTVNSNSNGAIATDRFLGEPDFNKWDRTSWMAGYKFEHRFDDVLQFRQNLRYANFKNDYADIYFSGFTSGSNQSSVNRGAYKRNDKSNLISVDNQLQADFATGPLQHTMLGGVDYLHGAFDRVQYNGTVAALNLYNPVYGSAVTLSSTPGTSSYQVSDQVGVYAQDSIKLGKWVLLLGGRQDWAGNDNENRLTNVTTRTDADAFSGRAGLVYLFENGLAPYVSYSESFEPNTTVNADGSSFDPTTGQQYEFGVKYEPPGMNSSVTLSWFDLRRQNVLTSQGSGNYTQTGEIMARGYELSAVASLAEGLNLVGGYTFTNSKVTKGLASEIGRKTNNVPEHMASLWLDYEIKEGDLAGLGFGGGSRYVGTTYNTANTAKAPDYTVFDAMVRYDLASWRFSLNAINLFDKTYVAGCTYACFYGDRLTVIGSVTYRW